MSTLFSAHHLGSLALANRLVVSPMCQYVGEDGKATAWHVAHLGSLAASGAGAVFIEATAVEPVGRITPGDLGLWDDITEAALGRAVEAMRVVSPQTRVILQLSHAGRKASSAEPWLGGQQLPLDARGWVTVAPSALPQIEGEQAPQALTLDGLARVREAFVAAALRAVRLGVDGIELHGAHGYLLHEFLSPISNRRDDAYGGTLENRMRFPLEVFSAMRASVPEQVPLGIKVSATDWVEGGWDLAQTIEFAQALKLRGLTWITVSSGGISPKQAIPVAPGYQIPLAQAIKDATGLSTIGVGLITEPQQAEDIIAAGRVDVVALARAMLYNPRWGWHAAAALGASIDAPPSYWRAVPAQHAQLFRNSRHGAR